MCYQYINEQILPKSQFRLGPQFMGTYPQLELLFLSSSCTPPAYFKFLQKKHKIYFFSCAVLLRRKMGKGEGDEDAWAPKLTWTNMSLPVNTCRSIPLPPPCRRGSRVFCTRACRDVPSCPDTLLRPQSFELLD